MSPHGDLRQPSNRRMTQRRPASPMSSRKKSRLRKSGAPRTASNTSGACGRSRTESPVSIRISNDQRAQTDAIWERFITLTLERILSERLREFLDGMEAELQELDQRLVGTDCEIPPLALAACRNGGGRRKKKSRYWSRWRTAPRPEPHRHDAVPRGGVSPSAEEKRRDAGSLRDALQAPHHRAR